MAANILQLTTRLGGASARLYISDDDQFRLFSRLDEDPFADILQVSVLNYQLSPHCSPLNMIGTHL